MASIATAGVGSTAGSAWVAVASTTGWEIVDVPTSGLDKTVALGKVTGVVAPPCRPSREEAWFADTEV
ncbi:hypothetical protein M8523_33315 [Hyphomicrobiales bacterium BP6-180914]|uniref:Uncharacterized protein n=1 Tax=Lichenifustis flavocetrariae TaxID=2949735 RepID=A0AA41Z220_9HYPH|nr:hypothetical protein [Lichenifustis flavocetrariae]